ncbi:Rv1733c family protein [Mycobacterium avium]|uniref:Rv1733c family protein n=1 Tax=Mycobacterium avium TaxID=1764 RepID=UPI0009FB9F96|nr:hypothetical protein [Mycobacterium avium]
MTTKGRDHQRLTGGRGGDAAAELETVHIPLPRILLAHLFGRNPLVRVSDRVQALILVLAVTVSLAAVPVAATIGTAVHESRSRVYAEPSQAWRTVTATAVGDSHPRRDLDSPTVRVPARWQYAGAEHAGDVIAPLNVKAGDTVEIWVDDTGSPVTPPDRTALDEAVAFAVVSWCAVSLPAAALFAAARAALDRRRYAAWQRDFDRLVDQR